MSYRMTSYNKETGIYYIPNNYDNTATTTRSKRIALAQWLKYNMLCCLDQTGCLPSDDDIEQATKCEEFVSTFGTITEDELRTGMFDMFVV